MFMDENVLLTNAPAVTLYHTYAKNEPIIDYHCHLDPKAIYENCQYENLTQLWLNDKGAGDHYKWRLMRTNGVPENLISGDGDDYEKYLAFVKTLDKALGNPIYEWSHLELRRYFGIDLQITEANAKAIWDAANAKIRTEAYRPREMIRAMKVKVACTTDDPADDLVYHKLLDAEDNGFMILPTFRPDNAWMIELPSFKTYAEKLGNVAGIKITDFKSLAKALANRVEYFHSVGGRLADQGLNSYVFASATPEELDTLTKRALAGETNFTTVELAAFSTAIQLELMREYTKHNWTMQIHVNALRNASTMLHRNVGINVGGDAMGDQPQVSTQLANLFAVAEEQGILPKTIVYSLNPSDWMPIASMIQSFQGGMVQRLQLGCAWWFNDTFDGMKQQLTVLAQQSLLGNFTGMLTDSRSFLSYPRHEYFRRVLCQLLGEWIEQGRIPDDMDYVGCKVKDICYGNAASYFGFLK